MAEVKVTLAFDAARAQRRLQDLEFAFRMSNRRQTARDVANMARAFLHGRIVYPEWADDVAMLPWSGYNEGNGSTD